MRLALVSDVHGNLPALEAVAADIRRRGNTWHCSQHAPPYDHR
jgi:hypothetical protein